MTYAPVPGPLNGLAVSVVGTHPALRSTRWILRHLGAEVTTRGEAEIVVTDERIVDDATVDGGVPRGTIDHVVGVLLGGAVLVDDDAVIDRRAVATLLYLPRLLGDGPPTRPHATGSGFVCTDLGAEGDADRFARLVDALGPGPSEPEKVAAEAQVWRLPVTPYRSRPGRSTLPSVVRGTRCRSARRRRGPVRVLDLTVMWSGPLATWLLAGIGAEVTKVEPECRLDGMRGSPMFDALHRGKERIELDLRGTEEREAFLRQASTADVVIDNFSPRVRGNLEIDAERLLEANPDLLSVSMPAFPQGSSEREWVSYGTGVHAVSGLGDLAGTSVAPAVAYPDPVAGVTAFATIAAYLRGRVSAHIEVPLRTAIEPLLALDDGSTLAHQAPPLPLVGFPECPVRR